MSACIPSATISVKEAVLAPKPMVVTPLLHRGGLSFTSARDHRSHVLTTYTQNAISGTQTTIPLRIAAMASFIRDCNRRSNAEIIADGMDRYNVTPVLVCPSKSQL